MRPEPTAGAPPHDGPATAVSDQGRTARNRWSGARSTTAWNSVGRLARNAGCETGPVPAPRGSRSCPERGHGRAQRNRCLMVVARLEQLGTTPVELVNVVHRRADVRTPAADLAVSAPIRPEAWRQRAKRSQPTRAPSPARARGAARGAAPAVGPAGAAVARQPQRPDVGGGFRRVGKAPLERREGHPAGERASRCAPTRGSSSASCCSVPRAGARSTAASAAEQGQHEHGGHDQPRARSGRSAGRRCRRRRW